VHEITSDPWGARNPCSWKMTMTPATCSWTRCTSMGSRRVPVAPARRRSRSFAVTTSTRSSPTKACRNDGARARASRALRKAAASVRGDQRLFGPEWRGRSVAPKAAQHRSARRASGTAPGRSILTACLPVKASTPARPRVIFGSAVSKKFPRWMRRAGRSSTRFAVVRW